MKLLAIILLFAAGASAVGCGGETTGGASKSGEPSGPFMTKFRIGRSVASDRTVAVETSFFGQGDSVYISFAVKNVPAKSLAKVVWIDSSKRKISEEQKPIASDTGIVSFELKDAADLAVGEYSVQFFYAEPGQTPEKWLNLGAHTFRIDPKRSLS